MVQFVHRTISVRQRNYEVMVRFQIWRIAATIMLLYNYLETTASDGTDPLFTYC